MRATLTFGDHWRRMQSVWPGSAARRSSGRKGQLLPIGLRLFAGDLRPGRMREDLTDTVTLLRPCPKRVHRRRWAIRQGEMNSVNKYTSCMTVPEFESQHVWTAAGLAPGTLRRALRPAGSRGTAPRRAHGRLTAGASRL
jgi:hypothetical protein